MLRVYMNTSAAARERRADSNGDSNLPTRLELNIAVLL